MKTIFLCLEGVLILLSGGLCLAALGMIPRRMRGGRHRRRNVTRN